MSEPSLKGRKILVVEDEYMLAEELRTALREAGAHVIGPIGSLAKAMTFLEGNPDLDGAVLDVNLGGDAVYPAADVLLARGVAVILATGYDLSSIPERYAHVPVCDKPILLSKIARAIGR